MGNLSAGNTGLIWVCMCFAIQYTVVWESSFDMCSHFFSVGVYLTKLIYTNVIYGVNIDIVMNEGVGQKSALAITHHLSIKLKEYFFLKIPKLYKNIMLRP